MTPLGVFQKFENEVIPIESDYKWTERRVKERELKPSWRDLTDKRIAVPGNLLKDILDCIEQKHFVILVGDKDTGKTWLSYMVGHNLVKEKKREVFYACVDDNFRADSALSEIVSKEIRFRTGPPRYIILDDCHKNREESEFFFQKILDEGEQNLRFLFTMRKSGKILLEDIEGADTFYNEGSKRDCLVRLLWDEMSKEHVKNIINIFIKVKEINYAIYEAELDDIAKNWGNDLFWVWLRLISWNYSDSQKLSDITNDQVCESVWTNKGEIKLSKRRQILFPLSVLCQFESLRVYELTNFLEEAKETLGKLKNEGIVDSSNWRGYDFVNVTENLANMILLTMSRKDASFRGNEISEQIQIFKDYLKLKPPNWYGVFYSLFLARESEKNDLAKNISKNLWNDIDILEIIIENVKNIPVGKMPFNLIDNLLWIEGKSSFKESIKASEIRSVYLRHNYTKLQNKLKSSSTTTISDYLPILGRYTNLNRFFDAFELADYESIINRSTINSIRKLFFYFHKKKLNLPSAAKKMAEALPDADLARLIAHENASLFRLGGLIGNVMQVDRSAAKRFVEKLSELDFTDLITREDPIAEEKGQTKVSRLYYFLSHWLKLAPREREKIVNNVDDDVWLGLIRSASFEDGFWLLWNIYVNNSNKAMHIVQNGVGDFLLRKCKEEMNEIFFLPLLGILHLCDFVIPDTPLIGWNIDKIKEILLTYKENKPYPQSTFLVLSLVALKFKLSQEQSENFKELFDWQLMGFINTEQDVKVREILNNLIKCYINPA